MYEELLVKYWWNSNQLYYNSTGLQFSYFRLYGKYVSNQPLRISREHILDKYM